MKWNKDRYQKGGRDWTDPERTGDENDSGRKYSSCRDKRGFTWQNFKRRT